MKKLNDAYVGCKLGSVNLQIFADFDAILESDDKLFGENRENITQAFKSVNETLKGMGYDVLINQRDKAEFVPGSRLSDVVAQREQFKSQVDTLTAQLNELKENGGMNTAAKAKLDEMIKTNEALVKQLQETNVQLEIMGAANDAINSKDILPFINMDNIKLDKDGNVVGGVAEEVDRVRKEKPYLFAAKETNTSSGGGFDGGNGGSGGSSGGQGFDMNAAIRRAAFGSHRSF